MKTNAFLSLILVVVLIIMYSCKSEQKPEIPTVDYCMELRLVDSSVALDTFRLLQGTELEIGTYKGGYGLSITTDCLFTLYGYPYRSNDMGFLRFGVVDFKIIEMKSYENPSIKSEKISEYKK